MPCCGIPVHPWQDETEGYPVLNLGKEFPIPEADWKDLARAVESGLRGDAPTWMDKGRSFIQQVQEAEQKTENIRMM